MTDTPKEQYCIFPRTAGKIKSLGKFDVKYDSDGQKHGGYYTFAVRYDGGQWYTKDIYHYHYQGSGSHPTDEMCGGARKMASRKPFFNVLNTGVEDAYGGYRSQRMYRGNQTRAIPERQDEFKTAVNADFAKWKKSKATKAAKKIAEAAESAGVSVETHKDNMRKREGAVLGVETTTLKIEILQHIEKMKSKLEEAGNALEANDFDQAMASDLREMGHTFGTRHGGIFPKMRKCASLIKKRTPARARKS